VNLYIGGVAGTLAANSKSYNPDYHVLGEGCINTPSIPASIYKYNLPNGTKWYFDNSRWFKRSRLLQLEQIYKQAGLL
jgi:hypothetical protein